MLIALIQLTHKFSSYIVNCKISDDKIFIAGFTLPEGNTNSSFEHTEENEE